jgi:YhgE/Pip-like protein
MMRITGPEERDTRGSGAAPISDGEGEARLAAGGARRDPYPVRAKHLLKVRGVWAIPVIVGSILLVLVTVFYVGSVVNPVGHLRGLPVSIVNEDAGASVGSRHVDLGAQLQSGLTSSRTVSTLLSLTPERLRAAESRMDQNGAYATVVIPPDFTASLLSLSGLRVPAGASAGKPTVQLLANQRAGTVGVELADGVLAPAIAVASQRIGHQLLAAARPAPPAGSATAAVLADPITFTSVDYRPLPSHSALGLSAFYIALLALMCGFLAATIINATVDAAQLLALILFVYLGLACAGGTVPLQALPSSLKLVSEIEPLRQILSGTRSILYFGAAGNAGLTLGIIAATAGLLFWLVLGAMVVRWYDRKGLYRLQPDLLAYVQRSVSAYHAQAQPQPQPADHGTRAPEA